MQHQMKQREILISLSDKIVSMMSETTDKDKQDLLEKYHEALQYAIDYLYVANCNLSRLWDYRGEELVVTNSCSLCGAELEDHQTTCPSCGEEISWRI